MTSEDVLTPYDAAEFLHISLKSLKRLCREQRITFIKIDRTHWLFEKADLLAFLERQKIEAARPISKLDRPILHRLDSAERVYETTEKQGAALRKEIAELWR
ncbi:MAG: helix-turn-helix domain-containing protein [Pseudomonadota bacterium]